MENEVAEQQPQVAPIPEAPADSTSTREIKQFRFEPVVGHSPLPNSEMRGTNLLEQAKKIKADEQSFTENELRADPYFQEAARNIVKFRDSDEFDFMSDDEVASYALDYIGQVNYNVPAAIAATMDYNEADETTMASMAYLLEAYEAKEIDARGVGRVAAGLLSDPSTYLSIGSMGFATGAQVAAKQGVKEVFKKMFLSKMGLASTESAAYAAGGTALLQNTEQDVGLREGYDTGEIAAAGALGAAAPKVLQKGFGAVAAGVDNLIGGR